MTDDFDNQIEPNQQPISLKRRRGTSGVLMPVGVAVVLVAGCFYLWLNYGGLLQAESGVGHQTAALRSRETVSLEDFQSFQRQTADALQSSVQDRAVQKADFKSLSDQLSALTAKVDALQSASAQSSQQAGAPSLPAQPPVVASARRKPSVPKTTGGISVGGAPLPASPPTGH